MTLRGLAASERLQTRNYARALCDGHGERSMDAAEPQGAAQGSEPTTILLLDDNAVQAATRQTILRRAGYFVIAALNPMRALEQFQSNDFPAEIQLVITDHLMPGMTGAEFVRALRQILPNLPVMVISGLEEAEEQYEGLNVLFRMKPLLPESLLASVQSLIAGERP
jgi:CheY-like chemotaxis protein